MDLFWKTSAGVLIAAVLIITIEKQEKDMALLLTMMVSAMAALVGLSFLKPVIAFLYERALCSAAGALSCASTAG